MDVHDLAMVIETEEAARSLSLDEFREWWLWSKPSEFRVRVSRALGAVSYFRATQYTSYNVYALLNPDSASHGRL